MVAVPLVVSTRDGDAEREQICEANHRVVLNLAPEVGDCRFLLRIFIEEAAGLECCQPFNPADQIALLHHLQLYSLEVGYLNSSKRAIEVCCRATHVIEILQNQIKRSLQTVDMSIPIAR